MSDYFYKSSSNVAHSTTPTLSAFITNLGKYNEGSLVGKWHEFPTTPEAIAQTFKEIGIDGIRYEEFFITDYETSVDGIHKHLPEYASIDELNYLASKIENLSIYELEVFEAVLESDDYKRSVKDFINLTANLEGYDYLQGVESDYDLGYYWVEESGCYDTKGMGSLSNYIDYERFGRDIALEEGGVFTANGYIRDNGNSFYEEYDGVDVPDEYKVFSMPKLEKSDKEIKNAKPPRFHDER